MLWKPCHAAVLLSTPALLLSLLQCMAAVAGYQACYTSWVLAHDHTAERRAAAWLKDQHQPTAEQPAGHCVKSKGSASPSQGRAGQSRAGQVGLGHDWQVSSWKCQANDAITNAA